MTLTIIIIVALLVAFAAGGYNGVLFLLAVSWACLIGTIVHYAWGT